MLAYVHALLQKCIGAVGVCSMGHSPVVAMFSMWVELAQGMLRNVSSFELFFLLVDAMKQA